MPIHQGNPIFTSYRSKMYVEIISIASLLNYNSLSATVILFGWDKVKCEGLLYYDGDAPVMALGVIIEKIRMDEIVEKLFKKKMAGVTWLTELNVGNVFSLSLLSNLKCLRRFIVASVCNVMICDKNNDKKGLVRLKIMIVITMITMMILTNDDDEG